MFVHFYGLTIDGFLRLTLSQTLSLLKAIPSSSEWSDKFGDFKE
jgi:hypothetical protein